MGDLESHRMEQGVDCVGLPGPADSAEREEAYLCRNRLQRRTFCARFRACENAERCARAIRSAAGIPSVRTGRRVPMKTDHKRIQFDNIATPGAPVWRRRLRKPYTCWAVRMELVRQSAELPDGERQLYVRRRLTELDKALGDDEAEALERWLDCEEMLCGRVKIGDYGDRTGGGSGMASPVPDRLVEALEAH